MHAMVLENVEEITEQNQSPGYEIGDHKLVFKNTYDSNKYGKEKKFTINAKDGKAPDYFYYVHIDVDLDQIEDCVESESDTSDDEEPSYTESDYSETTDKEFESDTSETSNDEELSSTESDQSESTDEEPEKKRRR